MNTGKLHRIRERHGPGNARMTGTRILPAFAGLALLLICSGAYADEVTMDNGDVVSGEVLVLKDGKLTIKTPYNDSLEIAWGSVRK